MADYKEREVLRIMPKCGHTFHLSCIDIWLRKQSTCPVCRLPLKNSSETKHVRPVTFTMSQPLDESHTSETFTRSQPLDESNTSERNEDIESHVEPAASNSLQPLDESNTSERNEDIERHVEPAASNFLQPTPGEPEARQ